MTSMNLMKCIKYDIEILTKDAISFILPDYLYSGIDNYNKNKKRLGLLLRKHGYKGYSELSLFDRCDYLYMIEYNKKMMEIKSHPILKFSKYNNERYIEYNFIKGRRDSSEKYYNILGCKKDRAMWRHTFFWEKVMWE